MPVGIPVASNGNSANHSKATTLKLTPEQYRLIEKRAERCGVKMTVWMRYVLVQAATRVSKDGYIRVPEPDGAAS
jgi:hypothetical protein